MVELIWTHGRLDSWVLTCGGPEARVGSVYTNCDDSSNVIVWIWEDYIADRAESVATEEEAKTACLASVKKSLAEVRLHAQEVEVYALAETLICELREAEADGSTLDWLVVQGCHLMSLHKTGCRRWDEMSLDFHGVWQHEDPAQTNCESELHALALCVVKVLENSLDNAPRSPVDER